MSFLDFSTLANHLWQSSVFAIAVWLVTLVLRKNSAAVRHRLWFAASLKFLIPFSVLLSLGSQFQWRTAAPAVTSAIPASFIELGQPFEVSNFSDIPTTSMTPPRTSRVPVVLFSIWIIGILVSICWWFTRWFQLRAALKRATPLPIDVPIPVVSCGELMEPGVFGIFRPVLMLPAGLNDRLSPAQTQAVVAHELSHVRRYDNLTSAVHMLVEAIFWFHPLVWWIKVRLIDEQERACDEEVLRRGIEPSVYAESLLKICEFYVESPLTCVSGVTGSDLKKRVARIMGNEVGEILNRWRKLVLLASGIAVLVVPIFLGMVYASPIRPSARQNSVRPADVPKWEVVSIKPCSPDTPPDFSPGPRSRNGPANSPLTPFIFSADRMTLNCRPVRFLIQSAYQTYLEPGSPGSSPKDDVLVGMGKTKTPTDGPAWIDSERYTIEAKAERVTDRVMMQGPMLQTILEDRFKIKVRWETRETELYAFVVAKSGPKLKPFQEGSCVPFPAGFFARIGGWGSSPPPDPLPTGQDYCSVGGGTFGGATGNVAYSGQGLTIDEFARLILSGRVLPFVIDKTGISGKFDIHLRWRLDDAARQRMADDGHPVSESDAPDLFKAVEEQLGLKLEKTKGPWEFQVIDHIERPTENAGSRAGTLPDESKIASRPSPIRSGVPVSQAARFEVRSIRSETRVVGVDMFSGTWILNVDQTNKANAESGGSRGNQGRGFSGIITEEIRANDEGITFTHDGILATGQKRHTEYTVKFDGKDYPAINTLDGQPDSNVPPLQYSARKIDEYTIGVTIKPILTQDRMGRWILPMPPAEETVSVSKDGKTRTVKQQVPDRPPFFMIWDRQ